MTTAVPALRATWRRSAQHDAEQIKRFVRLFVLSSVPAVTSLLMSGSSHFDRKTLLALLVPIAETAYRQVFPALGAAAADAAPGVTIVPDQVGLTTSAVTSNPPATVEIHPDAPAESDL